MREIETGLTDDSLTREEAKRLVIQNHLLPSLDFHPWIGKPMNMIRAMTIIANRKGWK